MLRMSDGSADRTKVLDLVAACLEQLDDRGPAIVDEVCAATPELKDVVRRRLAALQRLGLAKNSGAPQESFPEQLGEFRLLRCIGGGGMGVVYLAEQTSLARKVALKLIRPEHLFFPSARERFRREVDAVSRLRHPAVVPIYTFGESGSVPYYAMEWIDGASLEEVLHVLRKRRPQDLSGADLREALQACRDARDADQLPHDAEPPREIPGSPFAATSWVEACFRLILPVAHALEHAHRQGVVHRDLKPSNLMLTRDGRVLVLDFGLATTRGTSRLTQSGAQLGSLPFMPPELVRGGTGGGDAKSDFYSLGVTLYELLTLQRAFSDKDQDAERVRAAILAGHFPPLRELHPGLRWDAETVCLVAMERDPQRRYADATAFAADLEAVLTLRPIAARRPGALLRTRRFLQRHPAATVAAGAALLLATAVPGVFAWQQRARNVELAGMNTKLSRQVERTRSAVTRFLDATGNLALANVPGAEPLRRELVAQAVALFEELYREGPTPALRNELAQSASRLGLRCKELGDLAACERALARAEELFDAPGALPTVTLEDRVARAIVHGDRSVHLNEREADGALDALRAAVAEWALLCAERPDLPLRGNYCIALASLASSMELSIEEARAAVGELTAQLTSNGATARDPLDDLRLANGLLNLGNHLSRRDLHADGERLFREAARLTAGVEARVPGDLRTLELAALVQLELGQLLRVVDRIPEALVELRRGDAIAQRLATLFPARLEFRSHVGSFALIEGETLLDAGEAEAAVPRLRAAVASLERLQASAPAGSAPLQYLAPTSRALARALLETGDADGAAQAWRKARAQAQAVVQQSPRNAWAQAEVGEAWLFAARSPPLAALATDGESPLACANRALDAAELAIELAPDFPDFLELAREAGALCVRQWLPKVGTSDLAATRACLERLVEIGALDLDTIEETPELGPWMVDAEFRSVVEALQGE